MNNKVLYIGKSCKDFTHGKMYKYFGVFNITPSDDTIINGKNYINLTVYGNRGNMIQFNDDYFDYFEQNFKFVDDLEYNKYIRKIKLKKINK